MAELLHIRRTCTVWKAICLVDYKTSACRYYYIRSLLIVPSDGIIQQNIGNAQ